MAVINETDTPALGRSWFGGDLVVEPDTENDLQRAIAVVHAWASESGGEPLTGLLLGGQVVDAIPVNELGMTPRYQGPVGVDGMWIGTLTGPRVFVVGHPYRTATTSRQGITRYGTRTEVGAGELGDVAVSALEHAYDVNERLKPLLDQLGDLESIVELLSGAPVSTVRVPTAPRTLLLVSRTQTAFTASWTAPESDGGAPISSYLLRLLTGDGAPVSEQTLESLEATFTGLNPATEYSLVVEAVNAKGKSPAATLPVTTLSVATAPGAEKPTGVVTDVTPTSITLDWALPVAPAQPIVAWRFGYDTSDSRATPQTSSTGDITGTPADPYVFADLDPDIQYSVWVEARHAGATGAPPTPIIGPVTFDGANGSAPTNIGDGFKPAGANVSIQGNKLSLSTPAGAGAYQPGGRVVQVIKDNAGAAVQRANGEVVYESLTLAGGDARTVLFACSSSQVDNSSTAYSIEFRPGYVPRLVRAKEAVYETLDEATGLIADTTTLYDVAYRIKDGLLQATIWAHGTARPASPQISAQDSTPLGAGYWGVQINVGTGAAHTVLVDTMTMFDGTETSGATTVAGPRVTVTAKTDPAPVTPPPATGDGQLNGVVFGQFWSRYGGSSTQPAPYGCHMNEIPHALGQYNLMYGFCSWSAQPGTGLLTYQPYYSSDARHIADIAELHAASCDTVVSIGGGGNVNLRIQNETQIKQAVDTMAAILRKYGFKGIDWDIEDDTIATKEAIYEVSKRLKVLFPNLIVTMTPRRIDNTALAAAKMLNDDGLLSFIALQYYDNVVWSDFNQGIGYMRQDMAKITGPLGIPASKVGIGFCHESYNTRWGGKGGVSVALAKRYWDELRKTWPLRGMFVYDSPIEKAAGWPMTVLGAYIGAN